MLVTQPQSIKFSDFCNQIENNFDLGLNSQLITDFLQFLYGDSLKNCAIVFIDDDIDTQGEIHEFTDVLEEAAYLTKLLSFIFLKIAPEQPHIGIRYKD